MLDGQVGNLSARSWVVVEMLVVCNSISMPDLEEACCDCTFLCIDFKACPVTVEGNFVCLVLEGS